MNEEIGFIDAEFQSSGNEKIDFKQILMKQIDYIRFLRVQDMGEHALFEVGIERLGKDERFFLWITNAQKYHNSILALKSLLISYRDEEYLSKLSGIDKEYDRKLKQEILSLKKVCQAQRKNEAEYLREVKSLKSTFSLLELTNKYDKIFEETLLLASRAKFIGGNDTITEIA